MANDLSKYPDEALKANLDALKDAHKAATSTSKQMRKRESELKQRSEELAAEKAEHQAQLNKNIAKQEKAAGSFKSAADLHETAHRAHGHATNALARFAGPEMRTRMFAAVRVAMRDAGVVDLPRDAMKFPDADLELAVQEGVTGEEGLLAHLQAALERKLSIAGKDEREHKKAMDKAYKALLKAGIEVDTVRELLDGQGGKRAEVAADLREVTASAEKAEATIATVERSIDTIEAELKSRGARAGRSKSNVRPTTA